MTRDDASEPHPRRLEHGHERRKQGGQPQLWVRHLVDLQRFRGFVGGGRVISGLDQEDSDGPQGILPHGAVEARQGAVQMSY